ncbi:MAG: ABC transporter ATP-binding protein [Lachnospiraceae bacterium]|nr:ABC transporter ATP-binding protein [Lachnospiraceae bacterium]MDY5742129.1 ABC transporter ATP-binding protein [Lachnospiraceae bacterium]
MLEVENLCFSYTKKPLLQDISFALNPSRVICVLGENGSGKSTLFRCLLGLLRPQVGNIRYGGRDIRTLSAVDLSGLVAYIPQSHTPMFDYAVEDVILMGAAAKIGLFRAPNEGHRKQAVHIMENLGIRHLAQRGYSRISGGERQLVLIARALMSDARILLMDEPTANLDYGNQRRILRTILQLGERGYSVMVSLHDPQLVLDMDSDSLLLHHGRILDIGATSRVVTAAGLSQIYRYPVEIEEIEREGKRRRLCFAEINHVCVE